MHNKQRLEVLESAMKLITNHFHPCVVAVTTLRENGYPLCVVTPSSNNIPVDAFADLAAWVIEFAVANAKVFGMSENEVRAELVRRLNLDIGKESYTTITEVDERRINETP